MKILIANNAKALAQAMGEYPNTATVEAEYGDDVVQGTMCTLAHHGKYSHNPAPCITQIFPADSSVKRGYYIKGAVSEEQLEKFQKSWSGMTTGDDTFRVLVMDGGECRICEFPPDAIGISHVDLDTLGGILGLLERRRDGLTDGDGVFWNVAAEVDLLGAHHLEEILLPERITPEARIRKTVDGMMATTRRQIHAWWGWNEGHRIYPPRDGTVADVAEQVLEACEVIDRILAGDEALLELGDKWLAGQEALNVESYVDWFQFNPKDPKVVARASKRFCGNLFTAPDGETCGAMVYLNVETGAISVSLADPIPNVSCERIVKNLWGPEAGGRDVVAGSPRGQTFGIPDLIETAVYVATYLAQYGPS